MTFIENMTPIAVISIALIIGRFVVFGFPGKANRPTKGKTAGEPEYGEKWIVFNPNWPDPPTVWFETKEEAERVARLMAKRQPTDPFYVMKAITVSRAHGAETSELPGGDP